MEPKLLDALAFSFSVTTFAAGQHLHREGHIADRLFVLLSGSVQLTMRRSGVADGHIVCFLYEAVVQLYHFVEV